MNWAIKCNGNKNSIVFLYYINMKFIISINWKIPKIELKEIKVLLNAHGNRISIKIEFKKIQ